MKIGTRGSALALAQTRLVTRMIPEANLGEGGLELVVIETSGDRLKDATQPGGDKSRWVAELEYALLGGEIDLAVHSAKDVPGDIVDGLELLGVVERAAAEDALIGAPSLEELPLGGSVGTSSVRRRAQLLAIRPDLEVVSLRGNVDSRMRKLAHEVTSGNETTGGEDGGGGAFDAIVLASAGLHRLGRERDIGCTLDAERFVPAPGQGALALQARAGDQTARAAVEGILDRDATACLTAERTLAQALEASCNTPLGAHATTTGRDLVLRAWVGLPDGSEWAVDELLGDFHEPEELGHEMAGRMEAVGARDMLRRAGEMVVERG
jgi:hydroxymethylbilane synthase